ncbi:MAG: hypothetical protein IJB97_04780 [Clostridia bacterium]|nr:hypothetical protein [Clostridia bacterium]
MLIKTAWLSHAVFVFFAFRRIPATVKFGFVRLYMVIRASLTKYCDVYPPADPPHRKRGRYEQDKENAALSKGAYLSYATEPKRKFDEVLRCISPVYFNLRIS